MLEKGVAFVGWPAVAALVVASVIIASCTTWQTPGTVYEPAPIPGAEYVGMEACGTCHQELYKEFRTVGHGGFALPEAGEAPTGEGCETCHGPGSLHVQAAVAGGGYEGGQDILTGDWRRCLACHLEQKTRFNLRYHHQVEQGLVNCTDCHDPHEPTEPVHHAQEINETCFECHPEVRGPWAFPHVAVEEEGCTVCHDPHGSNLDKLLVADISNLCLRCHFQSDHPLIGDMDHSGFIPTGCFNCHQGVHGSNFSRTLRHP
jgi:predicted CXXCH cytochrome family protein